MHESVGQREHFAAALVYHRDMSDAKQDEAGQELDFDIFLAPVPETLPCPSWRYRSKAGIQGRNRNDAAVAERDNRKPLRRT